MGYKTTSVFGGSSYKRQISFIENSSIVVATPGRLLDLLEKKKINLKPKFIVLDEADEMLNMGFIDDIKKIFEFLPSERQTLMFSATMPENIKILAKKILKNPAEVKITPKNISNENIEQYFYILDETKRKEALLKLLENEKPYKSIIFCNTKIETDNLGKFLNKNKIKSLVLHGDIEQRERQRITKKFKKEKEFNILVATDVAARGLDIKNISHVFNFHIPQNPESYVHRIGRTGRAGKFGKAFSFVGLDEVEFLKNIQEKVKSKLIPSEIVNSQKDLDLRFQKLIENISKQKITKDGEKIFEKFNLDFSDELLKKIFSYLVSLEKNNFKKLSLSATEAERILEEFNFKRNSRRKLGTKNNKKRGLRNEKNFK